MTSHYVTESYICIIYDLQLVLHLILQPSFLVVVSGAGSGMFELTNQRRLGMLEETGAKKGRLRQRGAGQNEKTD